MDTPWSNATQCLIAAAIDEDLGEAGDITAALVDEPDQPVDASVVSRAAGVVCGLSLLATILSKFSQRLGADVRVVEGRESAATARDGDEIQPGETLARLRGPRAALLAAERTLLNFLCRMSGVATLTRRFVRAATAVAAGVKVYDTRKTIPGWRELEKYAVRVGGGHNHRSGLFDAILIKDNHLAGVPTGRLAATLFAMLNRSADLAQSPAFVEVEIDRLEQLAEVCKVVGVNVILLDNFSPADLRAAVRMRDELGLRGRVELEASGGVTLDNVGEVAASGVERMAVGALTHSAAALDVGLDF
jgi:nicotinate-nucleotide pyrophosphorylase (carboxylating)